MEVNLEFHLICYDTVQNGRSFQPCGRIEGKRAANNYADHEQIKNKNV